MLALPYSVTTQWVSMRGVVTGPLSRAHDARNLAVRGGGGGGDDRLAALGRVGPAHEVELAAGGAELVAQHVLGVAGAGQVDLDGAVDGDHLSFCAMTPGSVT